MAKMIHSMIRVLNEERSLAFYRTAFGLEVADRLGFDSFTLIYLSNPESGFELELTVNHGREEAYDLGNGYGHLAVSVPDVQAEHDRMSKAGLEPLQVKELRLHDHLVGKFFFIKDPDGYLIEVLERGGRFQ
ncbi:Lactoylglutathione lyase [Granulibacter bethesdensis]|uniref:Lactoylglutathione lyase n=1 Tax=Granulibacter bethesdensis TaxID=364410 RepID=A0AAC9KA75_9PROT|nr:VOC family protein [Granulibacter bethesdensis]APH54524.1 Lactoylglutathione lyase [Granulibacter bethesdensis]APH62110.1 Lactoylglutathione lyase [Granulibacter bethesdensis]